MAKKRKDNDYEQLVEQETLIFAVTEAVCELLEEMQLSRKELAQRLGRSKGFVTQLLSGERNMTLRTVADLGYALGHRFELTAVPLAGEADDGEKGNSGTNVDRPERSVRIAPASIRPHVVQRQNCPRASGRPQIRAINSRLAEGALHSIPLGNESEGPRPSRQLAG